MLNTSNSESGMDDFPQLMSAEELDEQFNGPKTIDDLRADEVTALNNSGVEELRVEPQEVDQETFMADVRSRISEQEDFMAEVKKRVEQADAEELIRKGTATTTLGAKKGNDSTPIQVKPKDEPWSGPGYKD